MNPRSDSVKESRLNRPEMLAPCETWTDFEMEDRKMAGEWSLEGGGRKIGWGGRGKMMGWAGNRERCLDLKRI